MLESAAGALRAAGARLVDTQPEVALPDVVRLYQQFLYPILLSTIAQRSFDNMVALAESLPADDDRPLARTARSPPSATGTGCSPTRNASSCAR